MAGTCDAQRPLPEMAGFASQMPKWSDGFLHSTGLLVEKDMHFQPLFRSIGFNFCSCIPRVEQAQVSSFVALFCLKEIMSLGASVGALGLTPTAATGNCLTLPGLESLEHLRAADPIGVEVRSGPFIEKLPISFVFLLTLHTSHFWGYI